jgi:predicted ATPase
MIIPIYAKVSLYKPLNLQNVAVKLVQQTSILSQVIISTQSVALANCFEPDDFIVVDYEEGESKFERFGKDKQEALKAWLENYQMGTTWEEGLIGGLPK